MQVYRCVRCGNLHDFALQAEGRYCDRCGAPLAYHGQELSPWGEHPMRDYDELLSRPLKQVAIERYLR